MDGNPNRLGAEFLVESGLLFEINRRVLHPLGLALEAVIGEDGEVRLDGLWDCRREPGGIVFDEESFQAGMKKYAQFVEDFGAEKLAERRRIHGFVDQWPLRMSLETMAMALATERWRRENYGDFLPPEPPDGRC